MDGVFVATVEPGSPADIGGMKPFDIIIEYNGEKADESAALRQAIAQTRPNIETDFKVWRDGKEVDLKITLGDRDNR